MFLIFWLYNLNQLLWFLKIEITFTVTHVCHVLCHLLFLYKTYKILAIIFSFSFVNVHFSQYISLLFIHQRWSETNIYLKIVNNVYFLFEEAFIMYFECTAILRTCFMAIFKDGGLCSWDNMYFKSYRYNPFLFIAFIMYSECSDNFRMCILDDMKDVVPH